MSADNDGKVSQNADNPMNHVGLDLDNFLISLAHISHPTTCWIFTKKSRKQLGNMMVWSSPTEQILWKRQPTS